MHATVPGCVKESVTPPPLLLLSSEDVWEIPAVGELPQGTDLPEEVSALAAGWLPGV